MLRMLFVSLITTRVVPILIIIPDGEHAWLASTLKVKFDLITQSIKEGLLAGC
jgi:hypothetical protein